MMQRSLCLSAGSGSKAARFRGTGWHMKSKIGISSSGLYAEVEEPLSMKNDGVSSTFSPRQRLATCCSLTELVQHLGLESSTLKSVNFANYRAKKERSESGLDTILHCLPNCI
jgi:hypothetical protein